MQRTTKEIPSTKPTYIVDDSGNAPRASKSTRQARPVYIHTSDQRTLFTLSAFSSHRCSITGDNAARVETELSLAALLAAVRTPQAGSDRKAIASDRFICSPAADLAHHTFLAQHAAHRRNRRGENVSDGSIRLDHLVDTHQRLLEIDHHG